MSARTAYEAMAKALAELDSQAPLRAAAAYALRDGMEVIWQDLTDDERVSLRGLRPNQNPKALRLVHDPDTGCNTPHKGRVCPFLAVYEEFHCSVVWQAVAEAAPAPPWCPLRAGDVVVSARKDGA